MVYSNDFNVLLALSNGKLSIRNRLEVFRNVFTRFKQNFAVWFLPISFQNYKELYAILNACTCSLLIL